MKKLVCLFLFFLTTPVFAQSIWSGNNPGTGNWGTANNWVGNNLPSGSNSITFNGSLRPTNNNNIVGLAPNSLTFALGASSFTLNGNSISLGGSLTNNSVNSQTLNFASINLTGNRTINTASGNISILSSIAGSYGIEKIGNSILSLSGNNTYSGLTTVNGGSLFQNGTHVNGDYLVNYILGGTGTIGSISTPSNIVFSGASNFYANVSDPLAVYGTMTFNSGFGIDNILGLNWDLLDLDTPYTIISTSQVFSSSDIENFGYANRASVGTGRFAYFQNGLQVVVVPEPNLFVGGLVVLATFWVCRKRLIKS